MTNWPEFERFGSLLLSHPFVFAKTMPANPHHYTLRKHWRDEDFVWAVEYLRAHGYPVKYSGRPYTYHDVNACAYWTMGAAINLPDGRPYTILINRKVRGGLVPYDALAPRYDDLFVTPDAEAEDMRVREIIGAVAPTETVLDVGCGTGLALRLGIPVQGYTGIDPSGVMLERLSEQFPDATVERSPLQTFVELLDDGALARYEHVLALYGVGSYLTNDELARLPLLLKPGGRATVMFYAAGYAPVTHVVGDVRAVFTPWGPPRARAFFTHVLPRDGESTMCQVGNHVVLSYQKHT